MICSPSLIQAVWEVFRSESAPSEAASKTTTSRTEYSLTHNWLCGWEGMGGIGLDGCL